MRYLMSLSWWGWARRNHRTRSGWLTTVLLSHVYVGPAFLGLALLTECETSGVFPLFCSAVPHPHPYARGNQGQTPPPWQRVGHFYEVRPHPEDPAWGPGACVVCLVWGPRFIPAEPCGPQALSPPGANPHIHFLSLTRWGRSCVLSCSETGRVRTSSAPIPRSSEFCPSLSSLLAQHGETWAPDIRPDFPFCPNS